MFVYDPDPFLLPSYRISPFQTSDIAFNATLNSNNSRKIFDQYLDDRFNQWFLTINGREAIRIALNQFDLSKESTVTILTTSGNKYISSCVTNEIERVCSWNRSLSSKTDLIFVNHEFGTVYPNMENLKKTGLPIIEDCCTTFFSDDEYGMLGKYGDFAVYSFPKFFPIQIGGVLVCNRGTKEFQSHLKQVERDYIRNVVGKYLERKEELIEHRRAIMQYQLSLFEEMGFSAFFEVNEKEILSVLMLNNHGVIGDLSALKKYLWKNGIQASVFYGEDAFFIPSHQRLNKMDVLYHYKLIEKYLTKNELL